MTLYMKVTRDKYELPIAVATSRCELAEMLGLSHGNVNDGFRRKATERHPSYVLVEIDDAEMSDEDMMLMGFRKGGRKKKILEGAE